MITIISAQTCLIIFDLCVIIIDNSTTHGSGKPTPFIHSAYIFLEWAQSAINLIILIFYALLFVKFLLLIRKMDARFGSLWKQVLGFFLVILTLLIINFVTDIVFYRCFDSGYNDFENKEVGEEKMVSIITYIHCASEILFNIVLLAFLIAQASDNTQEEPIMMQPGEEMTPVSETLNKYNRNSGPLIIQNIGKRQQMIESFENMPD